MQLDSAPTTARFTIQSNLVDDVVTYGNETSLFYADEASLSAIGNKFTRIGSFNPNYKNFTLLNDYKVVAEYFPIANETWSNTTWTQGKGIFSLRAGARSASQTLTPQRHYI